MAALVRWLSEQVLAAANSNDLNYIARTHMVKTDSHRLSSNFHICATVCMRTHMCTDERNKCLKL